MLCDVFRGQDWQRLSQTSGGLSMLAVIATMILGEFATRRNWQSAWSRLRSLAESIKSECFLCAVGVDEDRRQPASLKIKVQSMIEQVKDLGYSQRLREFPGHGVFQSMTIDEYVQRRLTDQIDNFYRRREKEFDRKIAAARILLLALAALALVFGLLGLLGQSFFASAIGLLSAVSAAIGVWIYSARLPYLSLSYGQTASTLQRMRRRWEIEGTSYGDAEIEAFVKDCESIISNENNEWRIVAKIE